VFVRGLNVVSADNIDVSFVGPVSIGAGDEFAFDIVVHNKNKLPLANTTLYIEFPDNTKRVGDLTQDLQHETETLDTIAAGGNNRRTMRAVLFGEELAKKEINVTIEYGVKNSNAVFRKKATYTVQISSAPLSLTVDQPKEVVSGDKVETIITVTSNSKTPLNNVVVKATLPFGFILENAQPKATYDQTIWVLPRINPGTTQKIVLSGRIEGQENDSRATHVVVGSQSETNEKSIGTIYLSNVQTIAIRRPALETKMTINGAANTSPVVRVGLTTGTLEITNTSSNDITNIEAVITFGGLALSPESIRSKQGAVNPASKTITWTKNLNGKLDKILPGESRLLEFEFATLGSQQLEQMKNAAITLQAQVKGQAVDSVTDNVQPLRTSLTRIAKVQSNVSLVANATYSTGPFKNTGPVPPKVGQKTKYTVTFIMSNAVNSVTSGRVEARLPQYVSWVGAVNPSSEVVTWNSNQSAVVWQVGTLNPLSTKNRQVSFQVEVKPTNEQLGIVADLVNSIQFSGVDTNSSQPIVVEAPSLTTQLVTDPRYTDDPGIVGN
jgi:hypothetical protein